MTCQNKRIVRGPKLSTSSSHPGVLVYGPAEDDKPTIEALTPVAPHRMEGDLCWPMPRPTARPGNRVHAIGNEIFNPDNESAFEREDVNAGREPENNSITIPAEGPSCRSRCASLRGKLNSCIGVWHGYGQRFAADPEWQRGTTA